MSTYEKKETPCAETSPSPTTSPIPTAALSSTPSPATAPTASTGTPARGGHDNSTAQLDDAGLCALWVDAKYVLERALPALYHNVYWLSSAIARTREAKRADTDEAKALFEHCKRDCLSEIHEYPQTLDRVIAAAQHLLALTEELKRRL